MTATSRRVVDAGMLNVLTPRHPQALVHALAEKCAVDIHSANRKLGGGNVDC
jgi:choline dehydrogenase-like flavoprotein